MKSIYVCITRGEAHDLKYRVTLNSKTQPGLELPTHEGPLDVLTDT